MSSLRGSYIIVAISQVAGPAAPRHPPERHVEQPAVPGRRARRAAGRRDHALLRGEVDGPDRGDTVDEETAKRKAKTHLGGHVLHGGDRGGASPGGMLVMADTMPMPAAAARAPIADCTPAARSCAAPRSSRAQLKARRRAGGAGATELVQQWAQRSKRSPRGVCRRFLSPVNVPPRRARPRRAWPFSRCAPGAAGAGWSRSSAPAPL